MLPPNVTRRAAGRKPNPAKQLRERPAAERTIEYACYVRVSDAKQEESGLGQAAQRTMLENYLAAKGVDPKSTRVRWFEEGAESARDNSIDKRPVLQELRAAVSRGEIGCVVVAKQDRLSRSFIDMARWMQECDATNTRWVALDLGVDTTTDVGRLVAGILVSVAAWELGNIKSRTKAALAEKRKQGVRLGQVPMAERYPWAPAVAYKLREQGETQERIAQVLWLHGLRTEGRPNGCKHCKHERQRCKRCRGGKLIDVGSLYRLYAAYNPNVPAPEPPPMAEGYELS